MVDLIIGDAISNLTLAVPAEPRLYPEARLDVFDAQASFQVEGCRGEFRTLLSASIVRDFAKKLSTFADATTSELLFWGGIDNEPDVEIKLRAKEGNLIAASVSFSLSTGKDTAHVYGLMRTMWSFDGGLYFEFDRSALSSLSQSLSTLKLTQL
ncbi:MAG: hypothetical protein K2P58_12510 [Hyphomonadaceae bacterium]|nr:hypothetical protein [Hyphomonadaceae bacterium]